MYRVLTAGRQEKKPFCQCYVNLEFTDFYSSQFSLMEWNTFYFIIKNTRVSIMNVSWVL